MAQENTLSLSKIKENLAAVQMDLAQYQASLRTAMLNSIASEDLVAIVKKQVEKAKDGDERAAKFVVGVLVGNGPSISLTQNNVITDPATAAKIAKGSG